MSGAWVLLGVSRFVIAAVPHARFARLLGRDLATAPAVPVVSPAQVARARTVCRAVARASAATPWESACYPQALTAHVLLSATRVPHATCFGVRREAESAELKAHAWVMAGPVAVSGGDGFADHATVRTYLWGRVPHAL
ncbi:hypothetical protein DSM112329_00809 [Paraconexibacter sp. AEG42_29]|uniref:Microcin J25-processing protein McjB C-terminal domain-containing protein n=2 Tax=Paraconexibacter sp. AEG42_29 TaxID=2997339 RepID=A0AAU7ARJ0_9ACTN